MSLKTIKVNPMFLSSSGSGGSVTFKNKTRKEKPAGVSLNAANNIKKKLISRIKNFQQEASNKALKNNALVVTDASNDFNNEFSDSVKFLDDLARNKEDDKKERRNTSLKKKHQPNPAAYMQIATELPPELDWNNILPPMASLAAAAPLAHVPAAHVPAAHVPSYATALTAAHALAAPHAPTAAPLAPTHALTAVQMPAPWIAPPQPSYGNLKKGGTKPTYRTWLRTTQKNKPLIKQPGINILNTEEAMPAAMFEEVDMMPQALAQISEPQIAQIEVPQTHQNVAEGSALSNPKGSALSNPKGSALSNPDTDVVGGLNPLQNVVGGPNPQYKPSVRCAKRKRITRTVKYKLGKHANGTVSVLIKNSQTRRKIQTEQALLKQKSILDVKNFLRGKNLLKVGSAAPNDVLRQIYEQSILAGQVENKAKDTLIHNYFNAEK